MCDRTADEPVDLYFLNPHPSTLILEVPRAKMPVCCTLLPSHSFYPICSLNPCQADLGGMCCDFLAYLAGPSVAETRQVAAALRQVDPEFDGGLIETSAANVGSKCLLRGEVATRLCLILDAERWRAQAEAAEAAAKAGGRVGLRGGAEDPFRHVPEAGEGNGDFEKEYGSALRDFVHQQVNASFAS